MRIADRVEALEQAEIGELLDGMRQRVDADAELADRVRLLEHLAVDPARMQHQPGHQAADAAAAMMTFMTLPLTHSFASRASLAGKASLPQVAENATICRRHGYDGVPAAAALRARLSILPTPVRGSASRKAMCFGHLYLTRFCLQ